VLPLLALTLQLILVLNIPLALVNLSSRFSKRGAQKEELHADASDSTDAEAGMVVELFTLSCTSKSNSSGDGQRALSSLCSLLCSFAAALLDSLDDFSPENGEPKKAPVVNLFRCRFPIRLLSNSCSSTYC
jgi:hypothetical protein